MLKIIKINYENRIEYLGYHNSIVEFHIAHYDNGDINRIQDSSLLSNYNNQELIKDLQDMTKDTNEFIYG